MLLFFSSLLFYIIWYLPVYSLIGRKGIQYMSAIHHVLVIHPAWIKYCREACLLSWNSLELRIRWSIPHDGFPDSRPAPDCPLQFILERCQIVQGWAIRAAEPIPQGTFICEYVGEVLKTDEAMKNAERFAILFFLYRTQEKLMEVLSCLENELRHMVIFPHYLVHSNTCIAKCWLNSSSNG